ncbi:MAG: iron-sulfur cluster-binding domain-containing protein [Burkholderiales bacterium]|nr:iron-sulfur cluster-binding domain-containing protein [Burkholderiales bacterium]
MNASHAVSLPAWHGQLIVAKIIDVAADVKVFRLVSPAGGSLPFHFAPGQYLSFRLAEGDRIFTRSYSICSAPGQQDFCDIAVKRMDEGRGSVYLHERIASGQSLTCIGPVGDFTFTGAEADSIVMIAGGIGITPLLSVLRHLAQSNWPHEVYLLFAIRTPADILFEQEIRAIAQRYRHFKYLILPSRVSGFAWEGPSGRIQAKHLADFVPHIDRRRVHLCGPEPMMAATIAVLQALNVSDAQIHTELFGNGNVVAIDGLAGATVTFATSAKTCFAPPGMTLLDAAEECGVAIESLCRAGTCGTCKVKMLAGEAIMQRDDALTTRDIQHRIVLACQARATTADIRLEC